MKIETERLLPIPLDDTEMTALTEAETDPALKEAYREMLAGCLAEPKKRLWYTAWVMQQKENPAAVVGDFCFKGLGKDGAVEIGYGLRDGFCGNGYMTEAVIAATEWALTQPEVSRVEAEADPDNQASQRVLACAGFVPTGKIGEEGPRFCRAK